MAQYVAGNRYKELHRCIDFIDIDSDKWAQYKNQASTIMKFVYGYEAHKLFEWEKRISQEFDYSFFVSEKESDLFKEMVPAASNRVSFFNNGVDTEYFSPNYSFESPYPGGIKAIVFTGVMDYWANVDAVTWFAKEVLPALSAHVPDAKFYIVGSKPNDKVKALAKQPNVIVSGRVEDVRPYLAHSTVAVAPMRIARGIQNKVLEAMAMGLTAVTSTQGFEGINATPGQEVLVIDEVNTWVQSLCELLTASNKNDIGTKARQLVIDQYSWHSSLEKLKDHLDATA
jgi:sugar transferase (PEP-CTERM/EpsH1 system associated)